MVHALTIFMVEPNSEERLLFETTFVSTLTKHNAMPTRDLAQRFALIASLHQR